MKRKVPETIEIYRDKIWKKFRKILTQLRVMMEQYLQQIGDASSQQRTGRRNQHGGPVLPKYQEWFILFLFFDMSCPISISYSDLLYSEVIQPIISCSSILHCRGYTNTVRN